MKKDVEHINKSEPAKFSEAWGDSVVCLVCVRVYGRVLRFCLSS